MKKCVDCNVEEGDKCSWDEHSTVSLSNLLLCLACETQFKSELEDVLLTTRGIPSVGRSIPGDETMHGKIQCYLPAPEAAPEVTGVIDYAPSPSFPDRLRTITFKWPSSERRPPVGSRVRFNVKVIEDYIGGASSGGAKQQEEIAIHVCLQQKP